MMHGLLLDESHTHVHQISRLSTQRLASLRTSNAYSYAYSAYSYPLSQIRNSFRPGVSRAVSVFHQTCQPVPLDASCHIADHIQVILAGFAEQSKASVLHMSSLFHAFILCQLWTMYLEVVSAGQTPPAHEQHAAALAILADFWAKVTPGILQLVSHSRVVRV